MEETEYQFTFDINNPQVLFDKIKNSELPLEEFIEELFLIGKIDENLKAEVEGILSPITESCIIKALRARNKISNTGKTSDYNKQIKTLIAFAKKSEHLNIGKLYCLLRTGKPDEGDLHIFSKKDPLALAPEFLGRFNGIQEFSTSYGFPETFPEQIGELTSLVELEIKEPWITKLPESIGQLSNLKTLTIKAFNLEEIPPSIQQLEKLNTLRIEGAHYDYDETKFKVPAWIGNLKTLKKLELAYLQEEELPEQLFPESIEEIYIAQQKNLKIIPSVKQCINLQEFKIVTSNCVEELPNELVNIESLERLFIINMHGLKVLDGNLVHSPQLKESKIDGVEAEITEPERSVKSMSSLTIRNLNYLNYLLKNPELYPNLEELSISSVFGLQDNKNGLGALKKLKRLKLYRVGINGPFINNLGDCTDLEDLEIYFWKGDHFPDLSNCTKLKSIRIHRCEHLELDFEQLPTQVEHLKVHDIKQINFESATQKTVDTFDVQLTSFINFSDIGKHQFEDISIYKHSNQTIDGVSKLEEFPASIANITKLKKAHWNFGIKNISDVFSTLPNLEELELFGYDGNYFDEPIDPIEYIAPEIMQSKSLRKFIIRNYLGNNLEEILSNKSQIEFLGLHSIVNGKTLPDLSHLRSLKELVLENHRSFESFENPLPQLEKLELSWCKKIQPAIYPQIAEMFHLKEVRLISLYDAFQRFPSEWNFLETLYLNNARISEIPSDIENFQNLRTLSLYGLNINSLPIEFKELKNLKSLSLINCWLKEIPLELAELELEELALHFSKFSGNNMKTAIYSILVNEHTKIVTEFGGTNISWAQASAKAARKKILT